MGQEEAPPTPTNPPNQEQSFPAPAEVATAPPYDPDASGFVAPPAAPQPPPYMGMGMAPYPPAPQPFMMQGMPGEQGVVVGQPVVNPGQYYPPQQPQPFPVHQQQPLPYPRQNSDMEQLGAIAVLIGGCVCYPVWLLGWMCISHRDPSTRVMARVSACMGTTSCFAFGLWIMIVIMTGAMFGNEISKMEHKCNSVTRHDSRECLDNPFCQFCSDTGSCSAGSDHSCINSFSTEQSLCSSLAPYKCSKYSSCTLDLKFPPPSPSRHSMTTTTGGPFPPPRRYFAPHSFCVVAPHDE